MLFVIHINVFESMLNQNKKKYSFPFLKNDPHCTTEMSEPYLKCYASLHSVLMESSKVFPKEKVRKKKLKVQQAYSYAHRRIKDPFIEANL